VLQVHALSAIRNIFEILMLALLVESVLVGDTLLFCPGRLLFLPRIFLFPQADLISELSLLLRNFDLLLKALFFNAEFAHTVLYQKLFHLFLFQEKLLLELA
jgi:hypothetical protein